MATAHAQSTRLNAALDRALAEVFSMDKNYGSVSEETLYESLGLAFLDTGSWAIAVAAGNADEPMHVVAMIDASGEFWRDGRAVGMYTEDEGVVLYDLCADCGVQHDKATPCPPPAWEEELANMQNDA